MMTNDWEAILSEGEGYKVEFKERPDEELSAGICAFANASGGKVYIGIHDKGYIVGADTSNSARCRIQEAVNKVEPRLKASIDEIGNVVVLTVPKGTQKPYSCPTGFYLRSGPVSQKLDRDSIVEFFRSEGRVRYDEMIRKDLPIDERFNEAAFKRYVQKANICEAIGREAILKNLNCAGMAGDRLCFTNAGALFFRVNDEDVLFRHAGIVCALYKGTNKVYILDAKEMNGDMLSNVEDAIIFLKKHLRVSYKIEGLRRENILELPEAALREAVINAVCHRDYFEKGSRVMVEVFDDRVDIVSPGGVCTGITRENFGTVTIARNPVVASMFFRIGYIEQMGTGIGRMMKAARKANVAEPTFVFEGLFKVTLKRNAVDITNPIVSPQAVASGNQEVASGNQAVVSGSQEGDRKQEIITIIKTNGQAYSSELAKTKGLSSGRIRALLRELVKEGAIEKIGDNRYARYILKR